MAWQWGNNTLAPGQTQRWWLSWSGYPGFEVIGVNPVTAGAEIQCSASGVENDGGSTRYFLTVHNAGKKAAQYSFTGSTGPGWTWGTSTLAPGQSQRWWLLWPTYPGLEIIGVRSLTSGVEIDYTAPAMETNADGSATYFITVTNNSATAGTYHFVGLTIC